eukprot:g48628.t1
MELQNLHRTRSQLSSVKQRSPSASSRYLTQTYVYLWFREGNSNMMIVTSYFKLIGYMTVTAVIRKTLKLHQASIFQ